MQITVSFSDVVALVVIIPLTYMIGLSGYDRVLGTKRANEFFEKSVNLARSLFERVGVLQ